MPNGKPNILFIMADDNADPFRAGQLQVGLPDGRVGLGDAAAKGPGR
jgi:hypothetical protein